MHMYNIEEYLEDMDQYIHNLKELQKENPEEAKREAKESLICSGVLDLESNVKEQICNL